MGKTEWVEVAREVASPNKEMDVHMTMPASAHMGGREG